MNRIISAAVVLSLLIAVTTVSAGNREGAFSISPVVGGITFSGEQHLQTSPLFGGRAGYNITKEIGVEALFDYSRTKSTISSTTLDFYRYGGDLLYHFWPDDKFVPYLAAGLAGMNLKSAPPLSSKTRGVFDYGLGFKYFVTEDMAWRGDARGLLYEVGKDRKSAIEYTTGVYIYFGSIPPVTKLADPPPPPVVVAKQPAAAVVLPPPLASLTASPASVMKGQSSILSWTTKDVTNCEIVPTLGSVKPQGQAAVTPDNNTLYTLTCTGEGGTAKSTATVEVIVPPPPPPIAVLTPAAQRFCNKPALLMINFDVDKYNIKPQYHNELKSVGDFLKEFPTSHGEIAGHTDSTASNAYNNKLSERRANSVKEYIVKNFGIAPERLTSKGYGEDKPIASNKTKEGRAKNRRMVANFVCE